MSNSPIVKESPQVDAEQRRLRFSDALWAKLDVLTDIYIGGIGGIGSWLALYISRIGHNLCIYEFDTLEEHNLGGQLYPGSAIGKSKFEACCQMISEFSGGENIELLDKLTEESEVGDICISAFDNMEARMLFFSLWEERESRQIFIDGRMTAECGQIFAVMPGREDEYRETLFSDEEVPDGICSYKATSHCGSLAAIIQTSLLNNYLANSNTGKDLFDVPFKTEFKLPLLSFEITK